MPEKTTPRRKALLVAVSVVGAALFLFIVFRAGHTHAPPAAGGDMRIVSLAPNVTEMLFALGLGEQVVAVTDYCDYPPEAAGTPIVGGFGVPNFERLLGLMPDLVVATDMERKDLPDMLRQAGIPMLVLGIANFDDLFEGLRRIGEAAGVPERAEQAVKEMEGALAETAQGFAHVPPESRPTVYAEIWNDPILAAGGPSFLTDVIEHAGGRNVARSVARAYATLDPERVVDWNPDFVLLCYMDPDKGAAKRLAARIGWGRLAAVQEGRIIDDIHPDLLLRPGPRLVEGVRALAEKLHGGERPDAPDERP